MIAVMILAVQMAFLVCVLQRIGPWKLIQQCGFVNLAISCSGL